LLLLGIQLFTDDIAGALIDWHFLAPLKKYPKNVVKCFGAQENVAENLPH